MYNWKGNLMASRIHLKYCKNILILRLMSNVREMTLQWFRNGSRKKFKTFEEHIIYSFKACDLEISNMSLLL